MRKYIIPGVGVIFCGILIYQTYTLNTIKEELANIIYQYGEEKFSRQIARNICEERKKQKISLKKP